MGASGSEGKKPKSFNELVDGLREEGYTVKFDTLTVGASGVTHHVDLLAERLEGEKVRKLVVGLKGSGKDPIKEMLTVFAIAFDVGAQPCYITGESLEERLVRHYGVILVSLDESVAK